MMLTASTRRIDGNVGHDPRTRLTWDCFTLRSYKRFRLSFVLHCIILHYSPSHITCRSGRKDGKRHPSHQQHAHPCSYLLYVRGAKRHNGQSQHGMMFRGVPLTQGCDPPPPLHWLGGVSGLAYHVSRLLQYKRSLMTLVVLYPVDYTSSQLTCAFLYISSRFCIRTSGVLDSISSCNLQIQVTDALRMVIRRICQGRIKV